MNSHDGMPPQHTRWSKKYVSACSSHDADLKTACGGLDSQTRIKNSPGLCTRESLTGNSISRVTTHPYGPGQNLSTGWSPRPSDDLPDGWSWLATTIGECHTFEVFSKGAQPTRMLGCGECQENVPDVLAPLIKSNSKQLRGAAWKKQLSGGKQGQWDSELLRCGGVVAGWQWWCWWCCNPVALAVVD